MKHCEPNQENDEDMRNRRILVVGVVETLNIGLAPNLPLLKIDEFPTLQEVCCFKNKIIEDKMRQAVSNLSETRNQLNLGQRALVRAVKDSDALLRARKDSGDVLQAKIKKKYRGFKFF